MSLVVGKIFILNFKFFLFIILNFKVSIYLYSDVFLKKSIIKTTSKRQELYNIKIKNDVYKKTKIYYPLLN